MDMQRATLGEIRSFLAVPSDRAARAALARIGVAARGRTVPWRSVLIGLQLDPALSDDALADLVRPLMTAAEVARLKGIHDETIHRWQREGTVALPPPLRIGPRGLRWIRAEIEAWEGLRRPVRFARLTRPRLPFGALFPAPGRR